METFHDILTAAWPEAINSLTAKQTKWCETYFSLAWSADVDEGQWSPKLIPSCATVARELGISRAASAKMKWRILKAIRPYYRDHLNQGVFDNILSRSAQISKQRAKERPEYVEIRKHRGKTRYIYWKAQTFNDDQIASQQIIYSAKEIRDNKQLAKLKHLPFEYSREHNSSVLNSWWYRKISKYAKKRKISLEKASFELHSFYWKLWPKNLDYSERVCRFCDELMPLGEVIQGRKITRRRKYCSDHCKTYHKRYK